MVARRIVLSAVTLGAVIACGTPEGEARPQLVVIVDSDLPLPSQVRDDPGLSGDATIDTVRIDVIGDDGAVRDVREIVAIEPASWPITLGVTTEARPALTLRVRAFRGVFAKSGPAAGVTVREPPLEASVDRLVRVRMPTEGVHHARIVLRGDCIGVPASLLDWTSCIDGERRSAPIAEGVEMDPPNPTATTVGTWPPAREAPCTAEPVADAVCVPGGVTVLGDLTLAAFDRGLDPLPLRTATLSPFYLDKTELTVGAYRKLLGKLKQTEAEAYLGTDPSRRFCTFLGADDARNDALPLDCVTWRAAAEICALRGGTLPTEAEWEHAARGRGQRRPFPWGDAPPKCCTASTSRETGLFASFCAGEGIEPVGSHRPSAACAGIGDESRDGVLDLGGSMREWVRDAYRPYSHACWGTGLLRDPLCVDGDDSVVHATRGGTWAAGTFLTLGALRSTTYISSNETGFRCRYPGR